MNDKISTIIICTEGGAFMEIYNDGAWKYKNFSEDRPRLKKGKWAMTDENKAICITRSMVLEQVNDLLSILDLSQIFGLNEKLNFPTTFVKDSKKYVKDKHSERHQKQQPS